MKFTPLRDRLVVRRDEAPAEVGGIILSEGARERLNRGVVLRTGREVRDVAEGDRVMFGRADGVQQTIEGEAVLILKENQIWCVLND